jgi:hypothetical protein
MAKHRKKKGDLSQIHVVVERRERVDRDMLSVALFGWIMDKLRAERPTAEPTPKPAEDNSTRSQEPS